MEKLLIFILAFAVAASAGTYSLDGACYNIGKAYIDNIGTCKYSDTELDYEPDYVRFTCKTPDNEISLIKVDKRTAEMIIFRNHKYGGEDIIQIYSTYCNLYEYDEYGVMTKHDTFLDKNAKSVYSYFKSTLNK